VPRPRPSRSSLPALVLVAAILGGCATAAPPPARPIADDARTALDRIEQHRRSLRDLRTLTDLTIRRSGRAQRLTGVLLLIGEPAALRFEALSPFGTPVLIVAGDAKSVTLWEVLDNRAYIAPASPDANRRWLGLAMSVEDLVALLGGRVRPMAEPTSVELLAADDVGPSLQLAGASGEQRIWFDPDTGQARKVEWTGKNPARVVFTPSPADGPPAGLKLDTPDGKLEVTARYRDPRMNTSLDPALLTVTVPEHVKIQDFR
jgi:outer membrane lipoprotein-sorting protein